MAFTSVLKPHRWRAGSQRAAAAAAGTSAGWPMSAGMRACTMGRVEIRIVLDRVEPPGGGLRVVPGAGHAHRPGNDEEIRFTGWLLRALYEVTGAAGTG